MRLVIVAATGGIGRHLLSQALTTGHDVTAVVRDPAKLPTTTGIRTVACDLTAPDPAALQEAVGPRRRGDAGNTAAGTRAITDAMKQTQCRRILVVSAAPVSTTPSPGRPHPPRRDPGEGFIMRYIGSPLTKRALGDHLADLALMEDTLRASGLDWTSLRPPRLTNGPRTGTYRTAKGRNLPGGIRISRADVADYMLRAINDSDTVKQAVGIAR
ncbi:Putative NADH-flavin reductase [Actinacidiphila alni]|uniref:Putative NADH-flavin reductase n=1 Tax=Actinacidiphila alni TaxID=380248 RepID=A0A1I2MIM1_9ACTN|nr:NAD(P)-binding oxidoreductase [Actinacidiphila alni]SFF90770.1 Putative NADH-flavin reductase [Actinacidiphila alni]